MTKSQNTKNEQQKDLCITSEQLTEQWKKGELPSGWYYTKLWKGCNVIDFFIGNQFLRYDDSHIVEVLAEVPDYVEWQNMVNCACEEHEANKRFIEENKRLKHDVGNLGYKIKNQRHEIDNRLKEIEKLKELLKECFEYIDWTDGTGSPISQQKLLDKINEALQ